MSEAWDEQRARAFGAMLQSWRSHRRLSQRELADRSGLSHTTVARLEAGKPGSRGKPVRPGPDSIRALVDALTDDGGGQAADDERQRIYIQFMRRAGYEVHVLAPAELVHVVSSEGDLSDPTAFARQATTSEIRSHLGRISTIVNGDALDEADLELIRATLWAYIRRFDPAWFTAAGTIQHVGSAPTRDDEDDGGDRA
jgi:transcriptional regulator with XRE-family HTH domain